MTPLRRDGAAPPAPIRPAPDGAATPLPGTFGLTADPSTMTFEDGLVIMGGSPLRLLRLSRRAATLLARWNTGATVGRRRDEQLLARRLVSSGMYVPHPAPPGFTEDDVTVVVPVRDRPGHLEALLGALKGLTCIVVDDASRDAARSERIARDAGATFIGLTTNVGPAGARNAGLEEAASALVAFVDSDCLPTGGWLTHLLGHFDDPLVAAAAPRIVPADGPAASALSRYEAVQSSLDRGGADGLVRQQSRIPYVPSAALIVRREVAAQPFFDPGLKGGEDVDVVWRLTGAGWDVRYVAGGVVTHAGPRTLGAFLSRRAFYGTTAAPLSKRHPGALAPVNTSAWSAAVWAFSATRRPAMAAAALGGSVMVLAHRLRGLVADPVGVAARIVGGGTAKSALPALGGLTRAWSPALLVAVLFRRTRRPAVAALLTPALRDWAAKPGGLDPLRYSALHVADDLAYGSGVWLGCLRERTLRPLLPRITLKARIWSASSLRAQLGGGAGPEG